MTLQRTAEKPSVLEIMLILTSSEQKTLELWISRSMLDTFFFLICRSALTKSMRELSLVGKQQGYLMRELSRKSSVHSGYRDSSNGIKGIQNKNFQP